MPKPAPEATPDSFRLRRAVGSDGARIAALYQRSFRATYGGRYAQTDLSAFLARFDERFFAATCAAADSAIILGEDVAGTLCGYAWLGPHDLGAFVADLPPARRWWALRHLYLSEAAKGQGLADQLMDAAIAESRHRHIHELYLTVLDGNTRAQRFYARRGFVAAGRYPYRLGASTDDDCILRLTL